MHPQIILDKPGRCPICGMDLIPIAQEAAVTKPHELAVSEETVKLMAIETSVVERRFVATEVRMVGKVDYDESRIKNIAAWVPGRIDRLYVDFTGTIVNKGDHMVYLYSPQLLSTIRAYSGSQVLPEFKTGQHRPYKTFFSHDG